MKLKQAHLVLGLALTLFGLSAGCHVPIEPWESSTAAGKADNVSDPSRESTLRVVQLGEYDLSDPAHETDEITFELDAGARSFQIEVVETTVTPGNSYQVFDLHGPDVDPEVDLGATHSLASLYGHELAYLLPSTDDPAVQPLPGTWRFKIRYLPTDDWLHHLYPPTGTRKVRVRVVVKETEFADQQEALTRGKLKVYFHFTGSHGLTAATATPIDSAFQKALNHIKRVFHREGASDAAQIEIVDAGYFDLDISSIPASDNGALMLPHLSQYIQQQNRLDGVHVMFIDNVDMVLEKAMYGIALHISGGLPGLLPATDVSYGGVLMATRSAYPGLTLDGNLIAHEIGHYLGLAHVTESNGVGTDAISDTHGTDFQNLMSWACRFEQDAQAQLTQGQMRVALAHPLVTLLKDE